MNRKLNLSATISIDDTGAQLTSIDWDAEEMSQAQAGAALQIVANHMVGGKASGVFVMRATPDGQGEYRTDSFWYLEGLEQINGLERARLLHRVSEAEFLALVAEGPRSLQDPEPIAYPSHPSETPRTADGGECGINPDPPPGD